MSFAPLPTGFDLAREILAPGNMGSIPGPEPLSVRERVPARSDAKAGYYEPELLDAMTDFGLFACGRVYDDPAHSTVVALRIIAHETAVA